MSSSGDRTAPPFAAGKKSGNRHLVIVRGGANQRHGNCISVVAADDLRFQEIIRDALQQLGKVVALGLGQAHRRACGL